MAPDAEFSSILAEAIATLEAGFAHLPAIDRANSDTSNSDTTNIDTAALRDAVLAAARRMRDNFPYHHPLYAGQMLKPPHPVAAIAYALAMQLNPNNHALDGGRASSAMEKETVADIARMFGWTECLGHLCGGGTMANLEALWIARELRPGKAIAASSQAHYTHARMARVLNVEFQSIAADPRGRMDVGALERALAGGQIGTVVATLGTTAAGAVDPLDRIVALRSRYDFRLHVDAAYGGYFTLAGNLAPDARGAFDAIGQADSIVVDPHKHGLQPYGCGCVLFADPSVGSIYKHDSPYTYFSSPDLHLGEISLECSRPGAAAVALWTTMKMLPLVRGGGFARGLEAGRDAAVDLHAALSRDPRFAPRFAPLLVPELDIVAWAVRAPTATLASQRARDVFIAAAQRELHFALATFPRAMVEASGAVESWDADRVTCLRACLMKPEHRDWLDEILALLDASCRATGK